MSGSFPFEVEYRDRVWRFQPVNYRGDWRVNVWAWYRDKGKLNPCGNRKGEAGFVLPLDRLDELAACLSETAADLRRRAATSE